MKVHFTALNVYVQYIFASNRVVHYYKWTCTRCAKGKGEEEKKKTNERFLI